ncbi:hypothetical protein SAVIM40S_03783 [Streptomyces avidinii]
MLRAVHFDAGGASPDRLLLCVHHLAVDGVCLLADPDGRPGRGLGGRRRLGVRFRPPTGRWSFRAWAHHLEQQAHAPEVLAELPFWRSALETAGTAPDPQAPWHRVPDPARDTARAPPAR